MARFSFFGDQEHRVFNYKPMYYDQEEEERRQMFGKVDGSIERENQEKGGHTPGSYIQGAFRMPSRLLQSRPNRLHFRASE